jgi:hypothetical protein
MRLISLMSAAFVLSAVPAPAAAQEWIEYTSKEDGFLVNFPGGPEVRQITFTSEYGYPLAARVYSAHRGQERYSMTVVDYRGIEQMAIERAKNCPVGAEPCRGQPTGVIGHAYWKNDVRGAINFATYKLLQRDAKLTHMSWEWTNLVEGLMIQLTNDADESRTFAAIHMHENRLYVQEGTVPKGSPVVPALFQQSLGFLDQDGNPVRYRDIIYSNAYHGMRVYAPPVAPPPAPAAAAGGDAPGGAQGVGAR